jgi:hypothetical protein
VLGSAGVLNLDNIFARGDHSCPTLSLDGMAALAKKSLRAKQFVKLE